MTSSLPELPFAWRIETPRPSYIIGTIHLEHDGLLRAAMQYLDATELFVLETSRDFQHTQSQLTLPPGISICQLMNHADAERVLGYVRDKWSSHMQADWVESHVKHCAHRKLWSLEGEIALLQLNPEYPKYVSAIESHKKLSAQFTSIASFGGLYYMNRSGLSVPVSVSEIQTLQKKIDSLGSYLREQDRNSEQIKNLDNYLRQHAEKTGKVGVGLDDPDEYMRLRDAVPCDEQVKDILAALNEQQVHDGRDEQLAQYLARDEEKFVIPRGQSTRLDATLYERNNLWFPRLKNALEKGNVTIGVGLAHLVGEEGLVKRLANAGVPITRC